MHIQERNNTTLTTCTKMTEEVDRRHGMNGNSSSKGVSDENSVPSPALPNNSASSGGRLKFYKDGKFILELERARSGERIRWVPVPRKTFWPPPPSAPVTPATPRQERAASLSVSDDNSSVQSSPWQRDHCWKQPSPRRGLSRELGLLYVRPSRLPPSLLATPAARRKRRRPLCPHPVPPLSNGLPRPLNGCGSPDASRDTADSPGAEPFRDKPTGIGKFKFLKKVEPEPPPLRVYRKSRKPVERRELGKIVEMLKERLPMQFAPVNAKLSALNCKQEHAMVSPRKRILRELERVSLEDTASKRSRARNVPPVPQPGPSAAPDAPPELYNGAPPPRRDPPVSKGVSSYSIHSILSMSEESPPRSSEPLPSRKPASHKREAPSPGPEHYRRHAAAWARSPPGPAYTAPTAYGSSRPPDKPEVYEAYREEAPVPFRLYSPYLPSTYLGGYPGYLRAPPLWPAYPSHPSHPAHPALPPGPWAQMPHPLLTDRATSQDASSDLPLNLSKH